ncbi:hypothetical protein JCM19379_01220 [Methyloparacoccus murrellii]
MKPVPLLMLSLLAGCSPALPPLTDQSDQVQLMARQRAMRDLHCADATADRPIRGDRMEDWSDELYSEYKAWAEGCQRRIQYQVVCRSGRPCAFADAPPSVDD